MDTGLSALLQRAWTSNEVLAVLVAGFLSTLGWLLVRYIVGRGQVGWGVSNQHWYNIAGNPPTPVYTRQIWIQNIGRSIAENVEVLLMSEPAHYEIWPKRHFTPVNNRDNSFMLKFDDLNPREYVTISMFQVNNPIPLVNNVRWKGGVGKEVRMGPQALLPSWKLHILRLVFWFGVFSIAYFIVKAFL